MATAQWFLKEVGTLVATLKNENHPAVQRLLPLYNEKCVKEIIGCWQTLQCVKQELAGIQSSMQNMTMLLMSIQQQLHHPSECSNFSTQPQPVPPPSLSGQEGGPQPSQAKSSGKGRKKKSAAEKLDEIKIDKNLLKLLIQGSPSQQTKPVHVQPGGPVGNYATQQPLYMEQPEIEANPTSCGQYVSNFSGQQYSPVSEPFDVIFK